jgi:CMP-N,N'-diacetyllegionaminic acid synthase
LIAYTIEQARASELFDHIVISTDSDEIAVCAEKYGAEVFFKRSREMASDTAGKLDVIKDAFIRSEEHYGERFDYLVDLDATSPLRSVEDIRNSFNQMIKDGNANLITAMPSRRSPYFNMVELSSEGRVELSKKIESSVVRRQDSPKTYDMNASIYIWSRDAILSCDSLFQEKTGLYIMPEERSIDIDSELDYKLVELIMKENDAEK